MKTSVVIALVPLGVPNWERVIGGFSVVTTLIKRGETAHMSQTDLGQLFVKHNAIVLLFDPKTGRLLDANEAAARFYGYSRCQMKQMNLAEISQRAATKMSSEAQQTPVVNDDDLNDSHKLANGSRCAVKVYSSPIVQDGQELIFSVVHDVTEQLAAERQLKLSLQVLANTREGVMVTDRKTRVISINPAFTAMTGFTEADMIGSRPSKLASGRHDPSFYSEMYAELSRQDYWSGEIWNQHKDGLTYPEMVSISAIRDTEGAVTNYLAIYSDISKIKQSEQRLEKLAHFDALTSLPNRLMLRTTMEHAIAMIKRQGRGKMGLLFLDLDQFKIVNDSQGHATGDELLRQVAARLESRIRESDTVARIGGDEFVVLVENVRQTDDLAVLASDIIETINQPFQLSSTEAFIGTSIGIAIYPDDARTADLLLTYADSAMYSAKDRGRNTYSFYTEGITRDAERKLKIANELRRALAKDELVLHYQPQIDLRSGKIVGAEALIRWNHPEDGLLAPGAFIDVAEERGLIHEISRWVISRGCQQLRAWQDQGLSLSLALNVSARDFSYDDFVEDIASIVELTDVDPNGLELELTESGIMENATSVLDALTAIRDMGIGLSIDDFGTGYSSFAYLKYLPINKLKIDRNFIGGLGSDNSDETIVSAVINLGKNFGLKVVAEGVETDSQQEQLKKLDCDLAQGFLFNKPLPANQFVSLLLADN